MSAADQIRALAAEARARIACCDFHAAANEARAEAFDEAADILDLPVPDHMPSRACFGIKPHPHGLECSTNCPTCHGRPL